MLGHKQAALCIRHKEAKDGWFVQGLRAITLVTLVTLAAFVVACQPAPKPKVSAFPAHFQAWLSANPDQAIEVDALREYLSREGVADVLPIWQLVQTETQEAAAKCDIPGFAVPPRDMWPVIVPTLRLVKQEIVPLLGPVKVLSSFRTNQANKCSLGAPESPHKRYSALDLAMVEPMAQKDMFAKLCKHWSGLSPRWGYGLGAYYVRGYPAYNQEGRFHVDTLGRRTWGYSYGAYTSHCRELGYIKVKSPEQIKAEEEAKLKLETDALAKSEADAKAKVVADLKAKTDGEVLAKAKAKEDARLKAVATLKAKVKADADAAAVKIMVPIVEPSAAKGTSDSEAAARPKN